MAAALNQSEKRLQVLEKYMPIKVIIVVRKSGKTSPEYCLEFELNVLPKIGEYISIRRPGDESGNTEDLVVRHVWWTFEAADEDGSSDNRLRGSLVDVMVECDKAIGPYSSSKWRKQLEEWSESTGQTIERFNITRMGV